jgi:hypothetical protein
MSNQLEFSNPSDELGQQRIGKLFLIGGVTAFVQMSTVLFAVVGYIIWPHVFNDAKAIFEGIQQRPFVYFMKLDPVVLIGTLLQLPVWLAIWAVLKKSNPSLTLIALAIGVISTVAILTTRPIVELFSLASLYTGTESLIEKEHFLAAGEALLSQFHGTAWAVSVMCGGIAGIVFGVLMLQQVFFRTATAWAMILSGIGALFVFVPVVGVILLFALATIGGMTASVLVGLDLLHTYKHFKSQ